MDASTSAMSQDASASTSAVVNAIVEEVIVGAVEEVPASAPTAVEEESTGVEATQEATADSAMEVDTVKETVLPSADEEKEESATTDAASSSTTGAPSAPATTDADLPNIDNPAWPAHSIVWAKVKGYPWWPGMVLRYENLPQFIRKKTIPKNKLAIFFFGTRDYTWVQASDLKPYNEQNQSLAGKVAKTNKKFADALEEVEDMGVRALYTANYLAMAADEQPHVATELVAESRKTVEEVAPKKKAGSALGKRKSIAESPATERKKSKTATGASSSSSKAKKQPAAVVEKPANERLLALRHKLQKIFLGDDMRVEEFGRVDDIMSTVETFPVTIDLLKETKIGKVINRISQMTIKKEPAKVVSRCKAVLEQWRKLLPPKVVAEESKAAAADSEAVVEEAKCTGETMAEDPKVTDAGEETVAPATSEESAAVDAPTEASAETPSVETSPSPNENTPVDTTSLSTSANLDEEEATVAAATTGDAAQKPVEVDTTMVESAGVAM